MDEHEDGPTDITWIKHSTRFAQARPLISMIIALPFWPIAIVVLLGAGLGIIVRTASGTHVNAKFIADTGLIALIVCLAFPFLGFAIRAYDL